MVLLFFGKLDETRLMIAGNEIAVQEIKKTAPTKTAHHFGMMITIKKPNIASRVNKVKAFLVPIFSVNHPPGKEYSAESKLSIPFKKPTEKVVPPIARRYNGRNLSAIFSPKPTIITMTSKDNIDRFNPKKQQKL